MFPALARGAADIAVGDDRLGGDELAGAVAAVAMQVAGARRVAVQAERRLETIVAVAGGLLAGCCVVPVNPDAGETERAHVLQDAQPELLLGPGDIDLQARASWPDGAASDPESPALIVYTSGTTGPPRGAVIPRRAVVACLDGLAERWQWSDDDVLAHALPLFHVHGLVLGSLGPLRVGSRLVVRPRFEPVAGATTYFAVPTMWSRLDDPALRSMAGARLLVSGSAALPAPVSERVHALTGHRLVERYGLTETLIVTAAVPGRDHSAGQVGHPLPGVGLRVVGADGDAPGEVQLSGPTLFSGYLGRPDATAAAYTADGWFRTGDLGRFDDDTGLRLFGRAATDLVKTGGYKVGAGEVEDALLAHPAVLEVAVTGEPDDDLGARIVAWVVVAEPVTAETLIKHVVRLLAPHKRPREVRFVDALPRNPMGKVQKSLLR